MGKPWTPQELATFLYQPGVTDPKAVVTKFSFTIDFGEFTRKATLNRDGTVDYVETAKRGQCLARLQGKKEP